MLHGQTRPPQVAHVVLVLVLLLVVLLMPLPVLVHLVVCWAPWRLLVPLCCGVLWRHRQQGEWAVAWASCWACH